MNQPSTGKQNGNVSLPDYPFPDSKRNATKKFSSRFSLDQALGIGLLGPDFDDLEASRFQQRTPIPLCAFAS